MKIMRDSKELGVHHSRPIYPFHKIASYLPGFITVKENMLDNFSIKITKKITHKINVYCHNLFFGHSSPFFLSKIKIK
jgi:hypothetical protein